MMVESAARVTPLGTRDRGAARAVRIAARPRPGAGSDVARLGRALSGSAREVRGLVAEWTPVIQARVAKVLARGGGLRTRGVLVIREDVRDMTQDVLLRLFADDARILREWRPERGLSLSGFVGLVAQRHALSVVRTRHRSPLSETPVDIDALALAHADHGQLSRLEHGELTRALLTELWAELSPLGRRVFVALYVEQRDTASLCAELGTTMDALHAWRGRIRKASQRIVDALEA